MNRIKSIVLLVIIVILGIVNSENVPLSNCGVGTAVLNEQYSKETATYPNGACNAMKPEGSIGIAGVNKAFFNDGKTCGACFRLTGPLGSVVVQVVNYCDPAGLCSQTDHAHFIISRDDFNQISNSSETSTIQSLGYQEVSCGFTQKIQYKVSTVNSDYMGVQFSGANAPIKGVYLKGVSAFTVSANIWSWRSNGNGVQKLSFPCTIILTPGINGGSYISFTIPSKPALGVYIDSGVQFTPNPPPSLPESCTQGYPNALIYGDALAAGWNDESFTTDGPVNYAHAGDPSGYDIWANIGRFGGVQIKWQGGFATQYISSIQFDVKTDTADPSLKLYLNDGMTNYKLFTPTVGTWTKCVANLTELKARDSESVITFQNNGPGPAIYEIDNIKFEFSNDQATQLPGIIDIIGPSTTGGSTSGGATSSSSSGTLTGVSGQISSGGSDIFGSSESTQEKTQDGSSASTISISTTLFFIISFIYLF